VYVLVCPSKIRSMVGLSDHIRDTHIEDETPGIQLFDTVAGKWIFDLLRETISRINKLNQDDISWTKIDGPIWKASLP